MFTIARNPPIKKTSVSYD